MCQGLDSHYFNIIGDGHQPNSRGLYTQYKDSLLKVGWPLDDHPQYNEFRPWLKWWSIQEKPFQDVQLSFKLGGLRSRARYKWSDLGPL